MMTTKTNQGNEKRPKMMRMSLDDHEEHGDNNNVLSISDKAATER